MRSVFSEKNLAILLFIMVLITFSFAQEDSRKKGLIQTGITEQQDNWRKQDPVKFSTATLDEKSNSTLYPVSVTE